MQRTTETMRMPPTTRKNAIAVRALALAASLGAAASPAGELRFAITIGPSTLDPHFHRRFSNTGMHPNIYEPLVGIDHDGQLAPQLAESW
jgi:ABC-type transport system substrate-binding protein